MRDDWSESLSKMNEFDTCMKNNDMEPGFKYGKENIINELVSS